MRKTLLPAVCLVLLFACSKSGSSLSKADLLTAQPWKIVADSILPGRNLNGVLVTDMYSTYKPCERDNYYVFSKDGTLEANNGPTKCYPSDHQFLKLTWFLEDGETKLRLSPDNQVFIIGIGTPSDIVELTATAMTLRSYDYNTDGSISRIHTLQFRH
ncbi:hypothetical protein [Niastella populi]|uniref:Lipocalin-like domain-containing protein n=1 Tax=Niastella populi TaxID=550983 RepID=A0A1V9GBN9_9BACT|nr:hypothetical protein [Niastella populi]OQP67856.1 hypothetical protein A4R26_10135 [Niastella populi]